MRFLILLPTLFVYQALWPQANCPPPNGYTELDGNQVAAGILTGGDFWWNLGDAKYRVPKSGQAHSIFAGALWIGGFDAGGQLRLAANTYRQKGIDYWTGPLDSTGNTNHAQCYGWDQHFKVERHIIDQHRQLAHNYGTASGGLIPINQVHLSIRNWPGKGNPFFLLRDGSPLVIDRDMAPFVDTDGDGDYNPQKGDYPLLYGDQMLWWVFNDNGGPHTESLGLPLGIDVKAMAYAFNVPGHLDFTTFYRFEITGHIQDLYDVQLAIWTDVDIGFAANDYIGCDTTRDMGIGYNGTMIDPGPYGYGSDPPYLGIQLLQVEDVSGIKNQKVMTGFHYYNNDISVIGNPEHSGHYYNYMTGRWKDSSLAMQGGVPTRFLFPDDPSDTNGFSECALGNNPADRRMIISSGPYTLPKDSTITLDVAAIWARCSPYVMCPSFKCIQDASDSVKAFFDNTVLHTTAPPQPELLGFQVVPNPAEGQATVRFEGPGATSVQIELIDLAGRVVYRASAAPPVHTIPTAHLPRGLYLVRAFDGNQAGHSKLVLK